MYATRQKIVVISPCILVEVYEVKVSSRTAGYVRWCWNLGAERLVSKSRLRDGGKTRNGEAKPRGRHLKKHPREAGVASSVDQ
jgi:hypothetical protein